jgi:hypothetical protein
LGPEYKNLPRTKLPGLRESIKQKIIKNGIKDAPVWCEQKSKLKIKQNKGE